ncbi:MAG: DUF1772 domain-containing protein [Deinococcota bacterium]
MKSHSRTQWLENGSIALATLALGIMAGFFWTYTFNVNLAMLELDGATYATVQSLLNVNVRHVMFFSFFFGAGVLSVIAVISNGGKWRSLTFWLLLIACMSYVVGIIFFTRQVNLPLNYYTESWNPQQLPDDWASVRSQWNRANSLRVGTSGLAFVLSLSALLSRTQQPVSISRSTR